MAKTVNVSLRIDPDVKADFKTELNARGEEMTSVIENFMKSYTKLSKDARGEG